MTFWSPHLYQRHARKLGLGPAVIDAALAHANTLQQRGLPPILTLRHLAALADVPYYFLRKVVERNLSEPYRSFSIKKRSGGFRRICVPSPSLLRVQTWLNRRLFQKIPAHPASFAYVRGRSIVDCARVHCGARWLVKTDIRHFFESVSERQVFHVLERLGYGRLLSFEVARICTRVFDRKPIRWNNLEPGRYTAINKYQSESVGSLPQGAPTSPQLSNLVASSLDEHFSSLAKRKKLVYTRYADDLVFSSSHDDFDRQAALDLVKQVNDHIRTSGFSPNYQKMSLCPPGARKIVLGLLIDGDSPRLSRKFKSRLESHLHYAGKLGLESHRKARRFRTLTGLSNHIDGLIAYAAQVEPDYAAALHARWTAAKDA